MRARTRQGQSTHADADQVVVEFGKTVRQMVSDLGVLKIYNADQTGKKTVWVRCGGKKKERVTVMLLADSDGVKYPPPHTLVYKSVVSQIPTVAEENRVQRSGFGVRLWKQCRTSRSARKYTIMLAFLLFDDFSGHWTQPVRDYVASINVIMLKVPPGYTPISQPADVCWMKPFKDQLRAQWIDYLCEQIEERRGSEPLKMTAPERENGADWICTTWDRLSVKPVNGGYRAIHTAVGDENEAAFFVARELTKLSLLDTTLGKIDSDNEFDE